MCQKVVVPICPQDDWKSWHNSSVVHPYCSWQCPYVKSLSCPYFLRYPLWHLKHFLRELCIGVTTILEFGKKTSKFLSMIKKSDPKLIISSWVISNSPYFPIFWGPFVFCLILLILWLPSNIPYVLNYS